MDVILVLPLSDLCRAEAPNQFQTGGAERREETFRAVDVAQSHRRLGGGGRRRHLWGRRGAGLVVSLAQARQGRSSMMLCKRRLVTGGQRLGFVNFASVVPLSAQFCLVC